MLTRRKPRSVKIGEFCSFKENSRINHIMNDREGYLRNGNPNQQIYCNKAPHFADASLFLCVNDSPFGISEHVSIIPIAYTADSNYRYNHYSKSRIAKIQMIVKTSDLLHVSDKGLCINSQRLKKRLDGLYNRDYKKNNLERSIELCMEAVNR